MNSTTETTATSQAAVVAEKGAHVAPKNAARKKATTPRKAAPKAKKTAKGAKKATTASVPREFSKKQIVLDLLRQKTGATLDEIITATGWLRHTCRGFLSVAGKTNKIAVEKTDAGRRYRIVK